MIISGLKLQSGGGNAELAIGDVVLSPKEVLEKDGKRFRLLPADGSVKVLSYNYPDLANSLGYGKSITRSKPVGLSSSAGSPITYSSQELFTIQPATDGRGRVLHASADFAGKWTKRSELPAEFDWASISMANNGLHGSNAVLYFSINNKFDNVPLLYKSVDHGVTVQPIWTNSGERKIFQGSLVAADNLIAFLTLSWNETEQYFVYSIDGGATWNERKILDGQGWFWTIAISQNSKTFYMANRSKLVKHRAGSGVFTETPIPVDDMYDVRGLAVDSYDQSLLIGCDAGLVYSPDGGTTFKHFPDLGYVSGLISDGYRKFYATGWDGFFSYEPDESSGTMTLKKELLSDLPEQGDSMTWASGDAIVYWTAGDEGIVKMLSGIADSKFIIPDVGFGPIGKIVASIL